MATGFDVDRFVRERTPEWRKLEALLTRVDERGMAMLDIDAAREFAKLYRAVSADLVRARSERVDASIADYLNDLVARAYARVHGAERSTRFARAIRFVGIGFPQLVRQEWRAIALSAFLFLLGAGVGAGATAFDPRSGSIFIPDQHQAFMPGERVAHDEAEGPARGDEAAGFASFLFTHNIQVTFLVFALGITAGIGSAATLFANGVPLGALAVQYHQADQGLFFWAWILPHGIPELSAIVIAGAAGLLLGRGIWLPGRRRRRDALIFEARRAMLLVLGCMPVLVVAGLIEGTISQMHAPFMPYWAKLVFAAIIGVALYAWLLGAGRKEPSSAQ